MIHDNDTSLMIVPGLSAEQLGAYMEGNLTDAERTAVENTLHDNPDAVGLIADINDTTIDWTDSIYDDYPDFDDNFHMPVIDAADYNDDLHDVSADITSDDFDNETDTSFDEADAFDDIDDEDSEPDDVELSDTPEQDGQSADLYADESEPSSIDIDIDDTADMAF